MILLSLQAANPGCLLGDFVRWYSPRDWIEDDPPSPPHSRRGSPSGGVAGEVSGAEDVGEDMERNAGMAGDVGVASETPNVAVSSEHEQSYEEEDGISKGEEPNSALSSRLQVEKEGGGEEEEWGGDGWGEEWDVVLDDVNNSVTKDESPVDREKRVSRKTYEIIFSI